VIALYRGGIDFDESKAKHEKFSLNMGGPSSKPKYVLMTDSEEYREGKVKRTSNRRVKENLKSDVYKQSAGLIIRFV
jgi:hypothetical protein